MNHQVSQIPPLARTDFGPRGNGAHVVIPSVAGPIIAAFLVFNRLFWRMRLIRTLGIDDLCIGLSLVFLFALAIVNIIGVNYGYGEPSTTLSLINQDLALQMFYLDQLFYKFTINLTKLSILTLYLRIFTRRWFVRTCWICFAIICAYATASILISVFQCTPIDYFWHKDHPRPESSDAVNNTTRPTLQEQIHEEIRHSGGSSTGGHCINSTAFWLANAVYNITTDVIILVALLFMIWTMRLPRPQKLGLTGVFGLGIFVFTTSVLRMTTLEKGSTAEDPITGTIISTMWTMIEASTAVICACLPMCRTPLQRLWPRMVNNIRAFELPRRRS